MNFEDFKALVIKTAQQCGLKEYELYYSHVEENSYTAYKGEIDQLSNTCGDGANFRCLVDGKMGYAATELFCAEEAERIVKDAQKCALVLESEDPDFLYDGKDEYVSVEEVDQTLQPAKLPIQAALELEKFCYAADSRVTSVSDCTFAEAVSEKRIVNSHGLDLCGKSHMHIAYAQATAEENGDVQAGFGISFGNKAADIDTDFIVKESVGDAVDMLGATSIPSGKYKVVISNTQAAALLSTFLDVFSADQAQKGLSLLAGKENTPIASELVTLCDDPMCEKVCCKAAFDADGVATYRKNVIEKGVFKTLLYNLKTAHKAGVKSTGNAYRGSYKAKVSTAPFAFYIEPGTKTPEEMFADIGDGLYVTELNGMHAGANAVTGDFSLAAKGFLIKDGKRDHAVKEITLAGNFFSLLKSVEEVGKDLRFSMPAGTTQIGAPSLSVGEMTVAGE